MARHNDGNRVLAVGETDGTGGVLVAEEFGERAVGRCRAIGNLAQRIPYAMLEPGAERFERQLECGAGAGEVFLQLLPGAREHFGSRSFGGFRPARLVRRRGTAAGSWEVHPGEGGIGSGENELADGTVERSEEHTSELQSPDHLVCRLLLEKKKKKKK